jgi:glucosamine-6-phosphate deaminase
MLEELHHLRDFLDTLEFQDLLAQNYFAPDDPVGRSRDVWEYLDGVAAEVPDSEYRGRARRLLRDLIEVFGIGDTAAIGPRIEALIGYFMSAYPGKKDPAEIQRLKGMRREWEAECLWGYFGWDPSHVLHLRLGFYTGDIFTEEPTVERDIPPILEALRIAKPDVVTVSLDPEASGPDTHYKSLQAITEALRRYERETGRSDIKMLGYRNVWHRFHPSEATICVPVSLNMLAILDSAFTNAYITQRDASFPSYEHDGPFSELAQRIQVDQYRKVKACLGREWFYQHPSALIRATRGLVFLREMDLTEFYEVSRELKESVESE